MADGQLPGCTSDIVFAACAPFSHHPVQSNLNWRIKQGASTHDCTDTSVHDLQLRKTARVEKGHLVINLETEKPRVCSTFSIVIQQACS